MLAAHRPRTPTKEPSLPPTAPRYGQRPEPSAAGSPHSPPGMEDPGWGGVGEGRPPPHHSLPIKTLIPFLISQWKGGMRGAGGFPPPCPGCVEVVQSHCRALYVLDYCYILYIFLFFCCCCCLFLFFFSVYICGIFRDSYTS